MNRFLDYCLFLNSLFFSNSLKQTHTFSAYTDNYRLMPVSIYWTDKAMDIQSKQTMSIPGLLSKVRVTIATEHFITAKNTFK